ncbi:response regulator transcription factor [Sphingomicrobium astaxanthinifaciens]|uniref:response regulator transcription factor n=1 Tax=Sphingomicrobium astaxanthinifaciens TaxID=1227949 RepID=UPI001FCADCCC|nr:helix-turn-helix transcriptional regulator [Sphingomicrobium astaxanthinifaciens]MCJ7420203.1 helix-turn-helix transcriptional regulator [Sphingomicrobium astaxanthinifaciens]
MNAFADPQYEPNWHLTDRESRILELVALGKSSKEVAKILAISPSTVDTHLENAKLKLCAHNRASLIARAIAAGLVKFDDRGAIVEHPAPDEPGAEQGHAS